LCLVVLGSELSHLIILGKDSIGKRIQRQGSLVIGINYFVRKRYRAWNPVDGSDKAVALDLRLADSDSVLILIDL
jgi:hypothetical protein